MPNQVSLALIITEISVFKQSSDPYQEYISIYILCGVCQASHCLLHTFAQSKYTLIDHFKCPKGRKRVNRIKREIITK